MLGWFKSKLAEIGTKQREEEARTLEARLEAVQKYVSASAGLARIYLRDTGRLAAADLAPVFESVEGGGAEAGMAIEESYRSIRVRIYTESTGEAYILSVAWAVYAKKQHPDRFRARTMSFLSVAAAPYAVPFSFLTPPDTIETFAFFAAHRTEQGVALRYPAELRSFLARMTELIGRKRDLFEEDIRAGRVVERSRDDRELLESLLA